MRTGECIVDVEIAELRQFFRQARVIGFLALVEP